MLHRPWNLCRATLVLWAVSLGFGCAPRAPAAAARLEEAVLSSDRLAEMLVLAQPLPLSREVAYELASHWVTLMALARQVAEGDSLLDSAGIARLMGPRMRQLVVQHWRERQGAAAGATPRAQAAGVDYAARLLAAKRAQLAPRAAEVVRTVARNPWNLADPDAPTATFDGGALTAGDLARHVQYLSPATRAEMLEAGEDRIEQFLWTMVLDELLWQQAESAGVELAASERDALSRQARQAVHALWERTGLAPAELRASAESSRNRYAIAARQVEAYLDAAAARRVPFEPVPTFLAVALLREVRWEIVPEGLDAAVERARRLLAGSGASPAPLDGPTSGSRRR